MLQLSLYPWVRSRFKITITFVGAMLLNGCVLMFDPIDNNLPPIKHIEASEIAPIVIKELSAIGKPKIKPTVAVYADAFTDQTGARLSNGQYASFSTAITQAPYLYLVRALHRAGEDNGGFFNVVERIGLDNLTKERQLIRNTRQQFEDEQELMPLKFAGLLIRGSVVGYESNVSSGGAGARFLGLGNSREYREDEVIISLRIISVSTGSVLLEVLVTKTILSASISQDVFRFITQGTELVEIEGGLVRNESVNLALQAAIETAVLQLIQEGSNKGFWSIE